VTLSRDAFAGTLFRPEDPAKDGRQQADRMAGRKKPPGQKGKSTGDGGAVTGLGVRMGGGFRRKDASRPKSGLGMDCPGWERGETVGSQWKKKTPRRYKEDAFRINGRRSQGEVRG